MTSVLCIIAGSGFTNMIGCFGLIFFNVSLLGYNLNDLKIPAIISVVVISAVGIDRTIKDMKCR